MFSINYVAPFVALASFLWIFRSLQLRLRSKRNLPYPPGPKGLPLIGNMRDIPSTHEWKKYHKWCKEYDTDILHLNVAGTSFIILDTSEVAVDLLEKRSTIYSGKPRMPMVNELMGFGWNFSLMDYGEVWRQHRRLMHQAFNHVAAKQFRHNTTRSVHRLLRKLVDEPNSDFLTVLRQMAGQTVMAIAYGIDTPSKAKQYIDKAEEALAIILEAAVPGAYLVDSWPVLKSVPEWLPGAGFQRTARETRKLSDEVLDAPFISVKKDIDTGISSLSFTTLSLNDIDQGADNVVSLELDIKSVAATMYSAGTDTSVAIISNCILGLLSNPGALKRAQEQLDSVLKPGHLPEFEEEDSLPYITAIVKEGLRWNSIIPYVIHTLNSNDVYRGYHIPAGSIVIANTWAMLNDETVYLDPWTYNPDRFMKDGKLVASLDRSPERDPDHAIWGFGRRVCPGRYMAFDQAWIAIASIISMFDIQKPIDSNGNVIEPTYEYTSGLISKPKPFGVVFRPRSKTAEAVIREIGAHDMG